MPESYFQYRGNKFAANANLWGVARSESIWWDCPVERIRNGEVAGVEQFFDFASFRTTSDINASEATWDKGLFAYGTTTAPVTAIDAAGGGVTFGSSGDNGGVAFRTPVQPFELTRTTGDFWFEALIETSTIADAKHDLFVGLIDNTAVSTSSPITTAGALADHNLVGFFRPETARTVAGTGGAIMNTVYKSSGVTAVTVQSDAVALAAATFTKVGMRYKASAVDSDKQGAASNDKFILSFYQDGRRLTTDKQLPAGAGDFPISTRLGFVIALMNATGSTPGTSGIRWARLAQLL